MTATISIFPINFYLTLAKRMAPYMTPLISHIGKNMITMMLDFYTNDRERKILEEKGYDYWLKNQNLIHPNEGDSAHEEFLSGLMHLTGLYDVEKDYDDAMARFLSLIMFSHKNLIKDIGIDSANISCEEAPFALLGLLYKEGLTHEGGEVIIEKNIQMAALLFREGALLWDPLAILYSTILHKENGDILLSAQGLSEYKQLLKKTGYNDTIKQISHITAPSTEAQKEAFGAIKRLEEEPTYFVDEEKKLKKSHPYKLFNLALAYQYGIGTSENKERAHELYMRAHRKGHEWGKIYADKLRLSSISDSSTLTEAPTPTREASSSSITSPPPVPISAKNKRKAAPELRESPVKQPKPSMVPASEAESSSATYEIQLPSSKKNKQKPEFALASDSVSKKIKLSGKFTANSLTERTVRVKEQDFTAEVKASKLDYTKIKYIKKPPEPTAPVKAKSPVIKRENNQLYSETTQLSEGAKTKIGRWGESCVYFLLKNRYKQNPKYRNYEVTLDETGFTLTDKNNLANYVKVIWHNKHEESGESKDFTITKSRNGVDKLRIVEVKSTMSDTAHFADFSAREVSRMLECHREDPERYVILRLYNAGKTAEAVRVEKIKSPVEQLLTGALKPGNCQLKI